MYKQTKQPGWPARSSNIHSGFRVVSKILLCSLLFSCSLPAPSADLQPEPSESKRPVAMPVSQSSKSPASNTQTLQNLRGSLLFTYRGERGTIYEVDIQTQISKLKASKSKLGETLPANPPVWLKPEDFPGAAEAIYDLLDDQQGYLYLLMSPFDRQSSRNGEKSLVYRVQIANKQVSFVGALPQEIRFEALTRINGKVYASGVDPDSQQRLLVEVQTQQTQPLQLAKLSVQGINQSLAWNPQGQLALFEPAAPSGGIFYLAETDAQQKQELLSAKELGTQNIIAATWNHQGNQLAYSTQDSLYLYSKNTGISEVTQIAKRPSDSYNAALLSWSQDDQFLSCIINRRIWFLSPSQQEPLFEIPLDINYSYGTFSALTWLPNQSQSVASSPPDPSQPRILRLKGGLLEATPFNGSSDIVYLDLATGIRKPVLQEQAFLGGRPKLIEDFKSDPQGRIYFKAQAAVNEPWTLYHYDLQQDQASPLTLATDQNIRYFHPEANGVRYVWNTSPGMLTASSEQASPVPFSYGSTQEFYFWNSRGQLLISSTEGLFLAQPDGTQRQKILDSVQSGLGRNTPMQCEWSPQEQRLLCLDYAFPDSRGRLKNAYLIDLNGKIKPLQLASATSMFWLTERYVGQIRLNNPSITGNEEPILYAVDTQDSQVYTVQGARISQKSSYLSLAQD